MKVKEMQLRPQAMKVREYMEINENEKTSYLVMKVSFTHLRLAGLLVAGVGCCFCHSYFNVELISISVTML